MRITSHSERQIGRGRARDRWEKGEKSESKQFACEPGDNNHIKTLSSESWSATELTITSIDTHPNRLRSVNPKATDMHTYAFRPRDTHIHTHAHTERTYLNVEPAGA